MSIYTKDRIIISADKKSYLEFHPGTKVFSIVVDGVTVTELTSTDVLPGGTPATHIADPTGGSTTDAEARAAIVSILNALEAFGIVAPA